jgi:hypothetical protein
LREPKASASFEAVLSESAMSTDVMSALAHAGVILFTTTGPVEGSDSQRLDGNAAKSRDRRTADPNNREAVNGAELIVLRV